MGAPKQKWSKEEESALRCGVIKHGPGRWRTILSDPDFSQLLFLRSNVDLKDKWRNINVMVNGWEWRKKTLSSFPSDEEIVNAKCFPTTSSSQRIPNWLDSLIIEAISIMKEPDGSTKTAVGNYIQERYKVPPNFKKLLSSKLKYLSACRTGKLIKVKRKYRIPNSTAFSSHRRKHLGTSSRKQSIGSLPPPKTDRDEVSVQSDAEFARMMILNIHEAAAVAAQTVAEAEAAMVEAQEAAKQAEVAEAEAEAAHAFAEEVSKSLKGIDICKVMICA